MKILALEFSSAQRSVAVVESGSGEGTVVLGEAVQASGSHTLAFALMEEALRQAQAERRQIGCIAVGLGPGSYTGIRMAISIAQGWQLAKGIRLLGVSSVEALALGAQEAGQRGLVHLVIDAHRNEFYLATYEITDEHIRESSSLRLATLAEVQAQARTGGVLAGPESKQWFPEGQGLFPQAAMLGRLAATRDHSIPGEQLEPIYLRPTRFVKAPRPRPIPL